MKIGMLPIVCLSVIVLSCSKNHKVDCLQGPLNALPYIPPSLFFNIVNKTTGQNLFLFPNPTYTIKQLVYFRKINVVTGNGSGILLDTIPVFIDSSRNSLFAAASSDTGYFVIANQSADTIVFGAIKSVPNGPCSYLYYIDSVKFDGQPYVAGNKQVITLKK